MRHIVAMDHGEREPSCTSNVARPDVIALSSSSSNDYNTSGQFDPDNPASDDFDPADPPPFCFAELRAAVPKHCFVRDPWRSLRYVSFDVSGIILLAAAAVYFNSWYFWPFYWVAQGQLFWLIFFIGHDCGHQAFSESSTLNNFVGYLVHSFLLIPYQSWRFTHRSHHQNQGHADKDESWVPVTKSVYRELPYMAKLLRFTVPFNLGIWPLYLWFGKLGTARSHFNPYSELFHPSDRKDVVLSNIWWGVMVILLGWASSVFGFQQVFKIYGVPYLVVVMWIDFVTYMQHHGHDEKLPWFRGKEWSYLRGAFTTVDVDYGWFNVFLHDAGTHLIHHIFPQIPHYHLREATEAIKPLLGKYYREPKRSGPFPWHAIKRLIKSIHSDHYVSDTGDIVYYQKDHELHKFPDWCKLKIINFFLNPKFSQVSGQT